MSFYKLWGKRLLDLGLVLGSAPLWVPILAIASVLIAFLDGGPILFRQPRPGLYGKIFTLYKLRTMTNGVETRIGKWLRMLSLDELPSLLNVLKGDMSLVGPRPLLTQYLERYTPEQMRRHEVLPGLTGLAQVSGRNLLTWEQKFSLDLRYVEGQSLRLDLSILAMTIIKVLRAHGVNASAKETMPEFMGSV